jgi:hypothetical protein
MMIDFPPWLAEKNAGSNVTNQWSGKDSRGQRSEIGIVIRLISDL